MISLFSSFYCTILRMVPCSCVTFFFLSKASMTDITRCYCHLLLYCRANTNIPVPQVTECFECEYCILSVSCLNLLCCDSALSLAKFNIFQHSARKVFTGALHSCGVAGLHWQSHHFTAIFNHLKPENWL